jgi:6-phosphofructokinase
VFVEFLNVMGRKAGHAVALAAVMELTPPFLALIIASATFGHLA